MRSIIIPAYNEGKSIARCINTILPQINADDEIIVVSSGSTDNTLQEVQKIEDGRVRIVVQKERKGKASAINLAVKKAKGDTIYQTDGDVELDENAIENLTYLFYDPEVVAVTGRPVPLIDENSKFYEWTMMSYRQIHERRLKEAEEGKLWHLSGYLLAFRKEAFEEIPFSKGAVDALMGLQLRKKGKIAYASDAVVYVKSPTTIKDFIAQKARVRAGYLNLKDITGEEMPRSIGSEIKSFPRELFKIKITRWPQFIFSGFVYALAWAKGKFIRKKSLDKIWKVPESTK